jgi:glycosyltransferase involved in cell wall biosynthesis
MSDITLIIASIPERGKLLGRALTSVSKQTLLPTKVIVSYDINNVGAPKTRQKALDDVSTNWVAFLDDDDELLPTHLEKLFNFAIETNADFVFPWFEVVGGIDPFPFFFGREFKGDSQTTITVLAKTSVIRAVNGFHWNDESDETDSSGNRAGEDFHLACKVLNAGFNIRHLPEKTWLWHHDSGNTSGMPSRRNNSAFKNTDIYNLNDI